MLYPKDIKVGITFMIFATTSKGSIMEIRWIRSFNVIPANIIRGAFNLHLSTLLCKLYCDISFIYLLFVTIMNF